jgi:ABC-type amino acid transport substrate-binding protein
LAVGRLVLFMAGLVTCQTSAFGKQAGKGRELVVASPSWIDYFETGRRGVAYEILNEIFQSQGYRIVHREMPYARALLEVEKGKADAMLDGFDFYRIDRFEYSKIPINFSLLSAVSRPGRKPAWRGAEDLTGRRVVWIRGYELDLVLPFPVEAIEVSSQEQAFKLLELGRADYLLDTKTTIESAMRELRLDKTRFEIHKVMDLPLYIRFHKDQRSKVLVDTFDAGMLRLYETGRLAAICARWPEFRETTCDLIVQHIAKSKR